MRLGKIQKDDEQRMFFSRRVTCDVSLTSFEAIVKKKKDLSCLSVRRGFCFVNFSFSQRLPFQSFQSTKSTCRLPFQVDAYLIMRNWQ